MSPPFVLSVALAKSKEALRQAQDRLREAKSKEAKEPVKTGSV